MVGSPRKRSTTKRARELLALAMHIFLVPLARELPERTARVLSHDSSKALPTLFHVPDSALRVLVDCARCCALAACGVVVELDAGLTHV